MNDSFIVTTYHKEIKFQPVNEIEEILQNVYTIMSTYKFTVPLFREFGTSASYLDMPSALSKMAYIKELIEVIEKFEARVIVEEILFYSDEQNGRLYPVANIRLKGVTL